VADEQRADGDVAPGPSGRDQGYAADTCTPRAVQNEGAAEVMGTKQSTTRR
jgi:hypothetical protein